MCNEFYSFLKGRYAKYEVRPTARQFYNDNEAYCKKHGISYESLRHRISVEKWAGAFTEVSQIIEKVKEKVKEEKTCEIQAIIEKELVTKDFVLNNLYKLARAAERHSDRIKSLELLGKHLKLFTDKVENETTGTFTEIVINRKPV